MTAATIRALRRTLIGALIMGVFVVAGLHASTVKAAPGINQQMNFQGRLLTASGATVADGYYNMQFKIYQDGTGTAAGNPSGTLKWTESWLNTNGNGVQVKNGYMSLQLGSITSLSSVDWNQDTLWLSINVGNTNVSCTPFTSCAGDGEMLPMKRLSSTPYAFNAGKLGGLSSAQFLQLAQGVQTEAANNTASIAINKTGTGGSFLNLQANSVDVFTVANTGDISFGNNIDHTIGVTTAAASTAGKSLTISAGTAGTGAGPLTGGTLVLQGGNGGGTGGNGGNITLDAGAAASGGVGGTVNIGTTNASAIILGQNTTLSSGKSLEITGSGTRPSSPTEGMVYFDTTTKQLITYSNGKWQSDRSTSTKIVAASNASQTLKDSADYIATGTSDQSTINTALTAAAGGKVYLTEGTYNTNDRIQIPNNTTLAGAGRSTLIQLGNLAGASKNMIENTDQGGTTGEGVVIRDLRIDGNSSVNTAGTVYGIYMNNLNGSSGASARSGVTIANVSVLNMHSDGIRLNASPNSSVTNSVVQGGGANGIYVSSSNRTEISNNTIQGTNGGGIWLAGAVNVTVTSNVLVANGTSGISLNGNSANNTISANNLANNGGSGANNSINLASVNNNQIIGNSIVDNAGTGAAIGIDSASANNYLSGNVFNGTGATSISDASTTTAYSGQSRSASGGQLTNRTANDAQAFTVQNATGTNIFAVDSSNNQVVLGSASTAGKLAMTDGSGHTGTIQMATGSGNYTYTLPAVTANDTFCLVTLNNCAADSTKFIQNQNTAAQTTATYWIDGTGRADTSLLSPKLDTATGVALNIGTTTATSVTIGKSSTTTTINGNLGVTLNATAGTTITCQNTSGYLSVCDSSVLTPSAANFIQNGTTVQTGANFWIDGYGKVAGGLQTGSVDTIGAGGSLNIGTGNAGSLTIGKTGVTTTIQGNIGVTLNATTGTTTVCRNATGLLSSCDASYLAPTGTNFILNGTSQQASSNFNISGTGVAGTLQAANIVGTTFDTATGVALNIGASGTPTTTAINLNQNVTVAAGKTLGISGDSRANITANITSPTEGMIVYDTTNHQMLKWNGTKWVNDGSNTYLVAASNSSQADKDAADYVATGSGDQVAIQAALDRADPASAISGARKSGKVYLFAGTYTLGAGLTIANNTTLAGAGAGTVITLPNAFNTNIYAITNATTGGNGTGIVIQDLKLDGNKAGQGTGTYAMYGIVLDGSGGGGSGAVAGSKISNVTVNNWYGHSSIWTSSGIYVINGSRNTFTNITAQGNSSAGILLNGTTYSTLTGGDFRSNVYGIYLYSAKNNSITNTSSSANTANGIYVYNASDSNTITGNIMVANTNTNIYLWGSNYNVISGNQARASTSNEGIGLTQTSTYNIVSGNNVQGNNTGGIYLGTSSTNNTITGNKVQDNGSSGNNKGINFAGASSNTVTNNSITDTAATTNNPILIDSSSNNNYLSNNTFSSTPGTGTISDSGTGTVYVNQSKAEGGGQITNRVANDAQAFTVQNASGTNILAVDTSASKVLVSGTLDTTTATTLNIGTASASAISIGSSGITTTIQGNTGVTLNATTGTTMVCRNASGVLSTCDAGYLAPNSTSFILNGTSQQASSNFNISGTGVATTFQAATSVLTPLLDAATSSTALNIGTSNASVINLNQNVALASTKTLSIAGDTRSNISSIASPTEGMITYDTTNKQLLVYSNGKWQADRSEALLVAASNSSDADKAAADYIADGNTAAALDGDQVQINQALTAAAGKKVVLLAGTYTIDASISVPNNTTLAGVGAGSLITIPNSFNTNINTIINTTTGGNGTGVAIRDLKLDGNKTNQSSGVMNGVYGNGAGSSSTIAGISVTNVIANNWLNNGITLNSSANSRVINNSTISNGYGVYVNNSTSSTVSGNVSSGNDTRSFSVNGSSYITLSGNVAQNGTGSGFSIASSTYTTITGNISQGNGYGVTLGSGSDHATLTGNTIVGNSVYGVNLSSTSYNTVSSNTIYDNGGSNNNGIYAASSSNNTITSNTISDSTHGTSNYAIYISDAASSTNYLADNTLGGGTVNDQGTGTIYGGQVDASGNFLIQPAGTVELMKNTNVTGTMSASTSVLSPTIDRATSGTLSIGTATATGVNIATNAAAHTVNIANGAAAQTVTVGSTDTTSALTLQGGTNGIALNTGSSSGSISFGVGSVNKFNITASTISANNAIYSFNDTSGNAILTLNENTSNVSVAWNRNLQVDGTANFAKGLTIQGATTAAVYTTPLGASLGTAINITNHDQAAYTTLLAMGVTAASDSTARGLLVADGRTVAHQATIGILSPDENQIAGLSYDGTNTTVSLKNSASTVSLQGGGINLLSTAKSGTDAITTLGVAGTNAGKLAFATAANGNMATIISASQSGNYTLSIPTLTANSTIMTDMSGIQNQNTAAQTANFWISGTGQAATLTAGTVNATTSLVTASIDTATGVALSIGGSTASSVDIGKSAGAINLKANSTLIGTAAASGTITVQGAAQTVGGSAGNEFKLKGSTGSTTGAGGQLTLQGGDGGGTSGANGGNVSISGGTGTGTGVNGLVIITTPTFSTVTNDANCFTGGNPVAANCTITAASVNGSSAVLVGFSTSAKTAILPNPTITTAGRVIYVTASNGSEDFTLSVNGGGQGNQIAMRKNTTATMIWNGAAWTAAGASSSTTMQAAYDNTLQSAGGAELVVSKTSATNGLTIRDAVGVTAVNGALLTVQSGSAANLFSVNSNVTEYATDPGAEVGGAGGGLLDNTFPASTWTALTGTTLSRYTTAGDYIATGQGSVSAAIPAATASAGVANRLSTTLTPNMTYNVSFSTRLLSGTFTDMAVYYSVDGSAISVTCATNQTAKTSIWSKINCTFQAPASGITANNAILIRQATGVIRTFYVDNLSVTIAADYNYATDGDVDDNTNFGTNWTYTTGTGTGTSTRNVSDGFNASSSATAAISAGAINAGVRNKLAINPLTSTLYRVSIYAKAVTAFNDFKVRYSPDGGSTFVDCVDYNTQVVSTTTWTPITCYIKTVGTTVTNPYVYFVEASSAIRTYSVDAFSMTLASNTTPNVQIGSGINGGPTTLFTVDKGASAPIAANNDALLGSMYYDTTLGKLQCYESDGWGACGSSPDNIVTISPEYTNAVMHGTGIGTMTSDLCSSSLNINDGTSGQSTICGSNETYNFYKWTSPQATAQTYSIYVTYQLPGTFKEFASGSTSIMGRTDSTNSTVQYQIYRSNSTSGLTACGASVVVSTGIKTSWQPGQATGAADPSTCNFAASDSVVFKISVTSSSNANAYIGNLGFTYSNR